MLPGAPFDLVDVAILATSQRLVTGRQAARFAAGARIRKCRATSVHVQVQGIGAGFIAHETGGDDLPGARLGQRHVQQRARGVAFIIVVGELFATGRAQQQVGVEVDRLQIHNCQLTRFAFEGIGVGITIAWQCGVRRFQPAVQCRGVLAFEQQISQLRGKPGQCGGIVHLDVGQRHRLPLRCFEFRQHQLRLGACCIAAVGSHPDVVLTGSRRVEHDSRAGGIELTEVVIAVPAAIRCVDDQRRVCRRAHEDAQLVGATGIVDTIVRLLGGDIPRAARAIVVGTVGPAGIDGNDVRVGTESGGQRVIAIQRCAPDILGSRWQAGQRHGDEQSACGIA